MAVIELKGHFFAKEIRGELNRDMTIYPNNPKLGAGALTFLPSGIYQMRRRPTKKLCVWCDFYPYVIVHNENIDPYRTKFADGVLAWQNLTSDKKKIYNKRASGKQMSGYNLFLRNYMYA